MSRYTNLGGGSKSGSAYGKWIAIWIIWLFMFLVILPPIMGCTGICDSISTSAILYLWFFVWTLGGAVTWTQMTFGIWGILLIIGCWDMQR